MKITVRCSRGIGGYSRQVIPGGYPTSRALTGTNTESGEGVFEPSFNTFTAYGAEKRFEFVPVPENATAEVFMENLAVRVATVRSWVAEMKRTREFDTECSREF